MEAKPPVSILTEELFYEALTDKLIAKWLLNEI